MAKKQAEKITVIMDSYGLSAKLAARVMELQDKGAELTLGEFYELAVLTLPGAETRAKGLKKPLYGIKPHYNLQCLGGSKSLNSLVTEHFGIEGRDSLIEASNQAEAEGHIHITRSVIFMHPAIAAALEEGRAEKKPKTTRRATNPMFA